MHKATDKIKKTIIGVTTLAFLISPLSFLFAEDYPAGFLGPGYRESLSEIKQNGYRVDVFTNIDLRQKERVNKRNQAEEIAAYASQAAPESANGILATEYQHKYNTDNLRVEIANLKQQREKNASAQGEFTYIPYSDGKIVYFQDGLVNRVVNERAVDEFGNLSIRNSYNYQYNDKRLLTSFEADIKDILGNITHTRQYGMQYTADSLFYGGKDTTANKNIIEYTLEETDPAGNKKVTHFYGGTYEGKLLHAFSQTIEDSIYGNSSFTRTNITYANNDPEQMSSYHEKGIGTDGLAYTLQRSNVTYNDKDQITGYHEVMITTQIDGTKTKTTVEAKFKYLGVEHQFGPDVEEPDPDKLLETEFNIVTENADGSYKTEKTITKYEYDEQNELVRGTAHSEFNGKESQWFEYRDGQGHILTKGTDADGNTIYSYIDPDTLETIIVPEDQVTATLKDGNKYQGYSDAQYEVLYGRPMTKEVHTSVSYYGQNINENELVRVEDSTVTYDNNLVVYQIGNGVTFSKVRVLGSQEYTEVSRPLIDPDNSHLEIHDFSRSYIYDEKGNLTDLVLISGIGSGWEYSDTRGWYYPYTSTITEEYVVTLGKPLRTYYSEEKHYLQGG